MSSTFFRRTIFSVAALAVGVSASAAAYAYSGQNGSPDAPRLAPDTANLVGDGIINDGFDFVPLSPCRIVDTRNAGGKIPSDTSRSFRVWGSSADFTGQGGISCPVPSDAVAAHLNITSSDSEADGFLTVWPFASGSRPNASILNYSKGVNVANAATVQLCFFGCAKEINVFAYGTTHVIIDVLGYYRPKIAIKVTAQGIQTANSPTGSSARNGVGQYTVSFYRPVTDCAVVGTIGESANTTYGASSIEVFDTATDGQVRVFTYNAAGAAADRPFRLVGVC